MYLFANTMRCPVPKTEMNPNKEDINTLLSELQNLIEQQHLIHKNDTSSVFLALHPSSLQATWKRGGRSEAAGAFRLFQAWVLQPGVTAGPEHEETAGKSPFLQTHHWAAHL